MESAATEDDGLQREEEGTLALKDTASKKVTSCKEKKVGRQK